MLVYSYGHKIRLYILLDKEGSVHKMSQRKSYTDTFKTMIVELISSGKSVKEVADEYSLSQTAIRNWVKKKVSIDVGEDTTNLEEILKIKKENARLKEENEILKKAMAIFAKK